MTTPRSGKDDNLWRDLAATVVGQVAERIRGINDSTSSTRQRESDRSGSPQPPRQSHTSGSGSGSGHRGSDSLNGSISELGGEFKKLMVTGLKMSAYQADEIKQKLETARSDRERKRLEAPMRKAQHRSRASKAGAIGLGVLTVGGIAGTVNAAMTEEPPVAVPVGVVTVGLGAGTFALNRRGNRYAQLADEEARRLGAASAQAVSLRGASAYSIPLPPQSSLAYEPTRRLVAQKQALADLLPDVEPLAPELAPLARESEQTLAQYAERVIKLERAQAAADGTSSLDAALGRAVAQYEDGVDAHQKLVEAAATVMAEMSGTGIADPAHHSMDAAADRLQGLAEGLRQVRHDIPLSATDTTWSPPPTQPAPRRGNGSNRRRGLAD